MTEVEEFIFNHEGTQKELLQFFHQLLTNDMGLNPKIRFKIPFYYQSSWICYLNPLKENGVELAFLRGNELSNSQGILSHNGRKQVAGIGFYSLNEIPLEAVREIIHEAFLLDKTIPYPSKRKK